MKELCFLGKARDFLVHVLKYCLVQQSVKTGKDYVFL